MAVKFNPIFFLYAACAILTASFSNAEATSDTAKMNVFQLFRYEMTLAHDNAAPKFMSENALAKWNSSIVPSFAQRDRQLSHFFAFSMLVPKRNQGDFYVMYFNPWVDGVLLTKWKNAGEDWRVEDFYFTPGERVRKEITPQFVVTNRNALPVWLRLNGTLVGSINQYYNDMSLWLLSKDAGEYMGWLSLSTAERAFDLKLLQMRMRARLELAVINLSKTNSGSRLSGAFSKLKYDALTGDKQKLASYSRHGAAIADLPADITKTWRENWYLRKGNTFSVILSSPVQPNLFLFMSILDSGKIEGVLLGDLEIMALQLRNTKIKAQPAHTAPALRKVQTYNDAKGNRVEVITEKRDGKVIMTTRVNGKVTEVLNF